MSSYSHVKDELCVYGELLLRGARILRDRVFKIAHEGHQGIVKTKKSVMKQGLVAKDGQRCGEAV